MDETTPPSACALPPEIERIILAYAVRSDVDKFVNYLLVAKYVHDWVMSIVFEVVILHDNRISPKMISIDQLKRYGHHARHVLLSEWLHLDGAASEQDIVALFPNAQNFALWTGDYNRETFAVLARVPLKTLSINIAQISTDQQILTPQLITLFSNITHLDLINELFEWPQCQAIVYFHALTNLSVWITTEVALIKDFLTRFRLLKVLIWLSGTWGQTAERVSEEISEEIRDIKLVAVQCSYLDDWENGARGREDMWSFAEKIVEARRAKLLIGTTS